MPPKKLKEQDTIPGSDSVDGQQKESSPTSAAKRKSGSPQKRIVVGASTPSTPSTRSMRSRTQDSAKETTKPIQAIEIPTPQKIIATDKIVGLKAKRGRPRKRPMEETPSQIDVKSGTSKSPDKTTSVPPKKRKGIRVIDNEINEVVEEPDIGQPIDLSSGDGPRAAEKEATVSEIPKEGEGDAEPEEKDEADKNEDKEDGVETMEDEEVAREEQNDIEATPSQKANIKTQRKNSSYDTLDNPPMSSNILQCPICNAYCVQLVRHIRTHHGEDPNIQAKIKEARAMEQKVQVGPSNKAGNMKSPKRPLVRPRNVQCPLCLKVVRRYDFNKHVRNVHSGEKPNKCPHCDYSSPWKGNLNTHIQGVHMKERTHACPSCTLTFKTRGALIGHVRKIHEGLYSSKERPYECETCHKMFFKKFHLERHIRIHTGEKPFHCVFCEKKFSSKTNLDTHVQSLHLKIKPFKCGYCEKGFLRKKQLLDHIQNHHVNPPMRKHTPRPKKKVLKDNGDDSENPTVIFVNNQQGATDMALSEQKQVMATNTHPVVAETTVGKSENSQTIIWRVQLPDGSQELHIRTCESDQTPQVLLIPQNQATSGEGEVIVLQPVQAKPSDMKIKPVTSQSLSIIAPGGVEPSPVTMTNSGETSHVVVAQDMEQNVDSNQHVDTEPIILSGDPLTQASISNMVPREEQSEIVSPEVQAVDQTDGSGSIQGIAETENIHILQSQDSNEAITISVLSPEGIAAQSDSTPNQTVPVMLSSTAQGLPTQIIDASSTNSVGQLVDSQTNNLAASQEYFYQPIPSSWQPVYNQSGQTFQAFQTSSGSYQFEVNNGSQTFTTPSVQTQFTTFAGANQSFTPVEPQPCGDLPQNFNVHSMEKTYQIVVSQPEQFQSAIDSEPVPAVTEQAIQIGEGVQEGSHDQEAFFCVTDES